MPSDPDQPDLPPQDDDSSEEGGPGEPAAIRVNFGRPMPLFPLEAVSLVPHAVLPLHIFEPRYRQMAGEALDGPGQIAMAVYDEESAPDEHLRPALRAAVCVGQIMQHHQLADGRYNIALHGVCRARIISELPPDEDRAYRLAYLEPVGLEDVAEQELAAPKDRLLEMLTHKPLTDLRDADAVVRHLRDGEVPTSAVLELVTFSMLTDAELRYRLLEEGDVRKRVVLVERELGRLRELLGKAAPQRRTDQPRGVHLN